MENFEKSFSENGVIYGVSSIYGFGVWRYVVYAFSSIDNAKKWLEESCNSSSESGYTCYYELMDEKTAKKEAGKKRFEEAIDGDYYISTGNTVPKFKEFFENM